MEHNGKEITNISINDVVELPRLLEVAVESLLYTEECLQARPLLSTTAIILVEVDQTSTLHRDSSPHYLF